MSKKKPKPLTVADIATEINHRIAAVKKEAKTAAREGFDGVQHTCEGIAQELARLVDWIEMRKAKR